MWLIRRGDYRDSVEFNPYRLSEIEERLNLIYQLKRKYGRSVPELLIYRAEIEKKLKDLQLGSEYTEELTADLSDAISEAQTLAFELSDKRKAAASELEALVEKELHTLGMEKPSSGFLCDLRCRRVAFCQLGTTDLN